MQIISDKYNEAFMDNLYQSIKNITPDQFREWSAIMDKAIASADIEMKRVVHKELKKAEDTGEAKTCYRVFWS